jgi:hypothetical protein
VSSLLIFSSLYFCSVPFNCPKHVGNILEMPPSLDSRASMMLVSQIHLVLSDESWKNARYGSWPTQANYARDTQRIFHPGHLVLNKELECNRGEQLLSCWRVSLGTEIFEQHKMWLKGCLIIISPWIHLCNTYYEHFWSSLWSSCQSSWLQIQRFGFDSRRYQIFWVVGLERGLLSFVSTTEELLVRKRSGSGLENWHYGRRDLLCWPRSTLYPQKLALSSPTSGGRSVGSSPADSGHEVCLFFF